MPCLRDGAFLAIIAGVSEDFVTGYIARAQPFAQPILLHIRDIVRAVSPEISEAKKWSMPAFTYKKGTVCGMAAFKAHVALSFWYGPMVTGGTGVERDAMGNFGRIASLADLPSDEELHRMVAASIELIDRGVKPPQFERAASPSGIAETPAVLVAALAGNSAAQAVWDGFPPGTRREYCEWISEAKRSETRDKRLAQTIEWIAEGKRRHWKYEVC